jgi:dipeptidyl aminopeptidase/acylaminoacyl peptidase
MNKRDSVYSDVYRLNVKTGELKIYLQNPGIITGWIPDADGKIRLVKSSNGVDETILFRANDKMKFTPIIKNNFRNSVIPIGFTGVKNYFYALSNVGRDKAAFVEINAENGKEERVIYSNDKVDIQRVDYIKPKYRLELATWEGAKPHKHFLNKDIEAIYNSLGKQLGGNEINITDRDTAEKKFIVSTYTDRSPGSVYLYERASNKLTNLCDNSSINPEELCFMKPISYHASDGLLINGYLTLPKGDSTNLPVVVMPHDGPFGPRNSWGYNAEVQFLANRGYAVFQVNYRGSSGYGKAFYNAGFKEVGGKIQQDITDGVNWLITNKIADPKKIAIFGHGGFGGFSALYGVSFNPHLYNCAIVKNGLINFFTYIKTAPPFLKPILQKMNETVGDPEKDAEQLKAISPVFHPDKPKAPLLIFQDAKDRRANINELERYIRELQRRNVQVKYFLNTKERESLDSENNRFKMYADIEKFLDSNMRIKH